MKAQTQQEIDNAFSVMAREKVGACIVMLDTFFIQQRHLAAGRWRPTGRP